MFVVVGVGDVDLVDVLFWEEFLSFWEDVDFEVLVVGDVYWVYYVLNYGEFVCKWIVEVVDVVNVGVCIDGWFECF